MFLFGKIAEAPEDRREKKRRKMKNLANSISFERKPAIFGSFSFFGNLVRFSSSRFGRAKPFFFCSP